MKPLRKSQTVAQAATRLASMKMKAKRCAAAVLLVFCFFLGGFLVIVQASDVGSATPGLAT